MPTTTPRRIARTATRVCALASTSAVSLAAGWAARLWTVRPYLTLMVFGLILGVAVVSGVAVVVARCQLSIAQAFSAGAAAGRRAPNPAPHMRSRPLRVVD